MSNSCERVTISSLDAGREGEGEVIECLNAFGRRFRFFFFLHMSLGVFKRR